MGECEPRNFLRPCLLLLLLERPDHGYELAERLHASFGEESDAGGIYRALRAFERQGLVRSTWTPSSTGPARRTYHITGAGTDSLQRQADALRHTLELLHFFLNRFRGLAEITPR